MLLIDAMLVTPPLKWRRVNCVWRDLAKSMAKLPPVKIMLEVKCPDTLGFLEPAMEDTADIED